jgi:hypothetical protein
MTFALDSMKMKEIKDLSSNFFSHEDHQSMRSTHQTLRRMTAADSDATIQILDQVNHIIDEENDFQLEPTPIGPRGVQIVPLISVQNDPTLYKNVDFLADVINVLSKKKGRNRDKLKVDDDDHRPSKKQRPESFEGLKIIPSMVLSGADIIGSCREESPSKHRFRNYQTEQWWERYQDMLHFHKTFGHCLVPNIFPENPQLAQWVKRQRYQLKLKCEGRHTTLTKEREATLDQMGFVWDLHSTAWMERWNELVSFHSKHGHSNVPTKYPENRQLSIWVKCQRRQHKLYLAGHRSNMSPGRISKMDSVDFVWNPRGLK